MKTIKTLADYLVLLEAINPYQAGRRLYKAVACGPWTEFVMGNGEKIYYESKEANDLLENCVGIRIGSIVEGSDAEIEPVLFKFPFKVEDWDKSIQNINDEASSLWEEANLFID